MCKKIKNIIILILTLVTLTGCSEECDSQIFSSYCDGNTLVYCAYEGGIENSSQQTVISEDCIDRDPNAPFCVEAQNEKDPESRANCVISKTKDPNCSLEEPFKSYCKNTFTHYCYYGYTKWVSGKGDCSE